jgi:hypothetical protein
MHPISYYYHNFQRFFQTHSFAMPQLGWSVRAGLYLGLLTVFLAVLLPTPSVGQGFALSIVIGLLVANILWTHVQLNLLRRRVRYLELRMHQLADHSAPTSDPQGIVPVESERFFSRNQTRH